MSENRRKKVLYLITKSNWGGAQRYVYDLATNLDHTKFEAVVALGGNGILAEMLGHAGIRTIPLSQLKNQAGLKATRAALAEFSMILKAEKPDILHVNSSVAGIIGSLAGRLAGVPNIIFTAHGWAFNEDRPLWQRLILKSVHYTTVLLSHRTIAVSRAIVHQMNWPGAERKMKVINPGRTIGPMYEYFEAREKLIGFHPALHAYARDPWAVCIAELHPIKRHSVLFRAMAELRHKHPTLRLIVIGDGSERARLEHEIRLEGLEEHIFLTGNIVEAARFLKAFDLFVLASKSESYGYVLHEAGLARVPVIATNVGGIPDIITDHVSGLLVPPDSAPALEEAINTTLTNKDTSAKFTSALYEDLSRRTVAKMATQTSQLY
jgi:glycosyltransferase involved in cell wall biosynthesis